MYSDACASWRYGETTCFDSVPLVSALLSLFTPLHSFPQGTYTYPFMPCTSLWCLSSVVLPFLRSFPAYFLLSSPRSIPFFKLPSLFGCLSEFDLNFYLCVSMFTVKLMMMMMMIKDRRLESKVLLFFMFYDPQLVEDSQDRMMRYRVRMLE